MKKVSHWVFAGLFLTLLVISGCASLPQSQLAAGQDEFWVNSQYHIDDPNEFDPDLDFH